MRPDFFTICAHERSGVRSRHNFNAMKGGTVMGTKAAINLAITLAIIALIVAAQPAAVSAGATAQQQSNQTIDNTPAFGGGPIGDDPAWRKETHKAPGYACPSTPYIDCMPPVKKSAQKWCGSDYRKWAWNNCPGVKFPY
jgi:hypothetical protein